MAEKDIILRAGIGMTIISETGNVVTLFGDAARYLSFEWEFVKRPRLLILAATKVQTVREEQPFTIYSGVHAYKGTFCRSPDGLEVRLRFAEYHPSNLRSAISPEYRIDLQLDEVEAYLQTLLKNLQ